MCRFVAVEKFVQPQKEIWAEYEVYMRHVLLCGDFPRILILCVAMWGLHHWTPVWDGSDLAQQKSKALAPLDETMKQSLEVFLKQNPGLIIWY